ncbi:hypothetical protein SAMN02745152_01442 [Treponema berlinense]|uniref:Uncharacterized protein n=1 Tax=Treponema berlinense TaxID=225004 RepID=A0A1T4P5I1_9SPIR|nr:hypothetical protein [Treponema berlinense]SJZ86587.1 hypothetical protein SAMN02745152_01442 [Treponema berlinense]
MTVFEYQIECTTRDLADKLVGDFSMTVPQALRVVYNSETYEKLINPKTGLYFQSPLYVYDFLKNEVLTGKMS